jgi:hypothetical protein
MTIDQYDDRRLSETLVSAMKAKGLTVPKLSEVTGIAERIIELFLAERYDGLPAAPYVRGYLLKLAEALGLEGELLWDAYGRFHAEIRRAGQRDVLPQNRFALPRVSRKFLVGGALALVVVGFILSRFIFGGASFTFEVNVPDDLVVATSTYALEGRVRAGDRLTLNGASVTLDREGTFARAWELAPGFNTLRFVVTRPLEGEREFAKQIFYEAPTAPSTF